MYKNQLQELAQRSCFNLPCYTCIREGPDHAPRFKASVNFNGDVFESPAFCSTLRQAEHSAAEVALHSLSSLGPSPSLAARILDETGVYKNLLQEISQRVGAPLPSYTTIRSGLGHLPVFTCMVELAGIEFTGEPAKNKKQAEKNAAMAAWSSLKQLAKETANSSSEPGNSDELEQITIARALLNYRLKEKMAMSNSSSARPIRKKFPVQHEKKPSLKQTAPATGSKILPLIQQNFAPRMRPTSPATNDRVLPPPPPHFLRPESRGNQPCNFPVAGAAPYVPVRHYNMYYHGMAPPVTVRTAMPCFSAPPLPNQPGLQIPPVMNPPVRMASPVRIRPAAFAFAAPPSGPAESSVNTVQQKKEPIVIQKFLLDTVLPDPRVTPLHLKRELPVQLKKEPPLAAVASGNPPQLIPVPVKEIQPVAAEELPLNVLPDSPFVPNHVPNQVKELPTAVVSSPGAVPEVQVEAIGGTGKNLPETGALEGLKRLVL